ncbi:MAG: NADH-quinone oxidoreductase subunit J [Phycisphaerales bacterium]|nr:NADH-quinone oxidoreductase subunit J [Phycisphaerales bacterium]
MDLFNPLLLYAGCALGAVGVAVALPRRGINPQVVGGLIAAVAFGLIMLALARSLDHLPTVTFYIFGVIAVGGALRVISHPRPVYSALYFILTILASSGLYLLLSAEFMAFALVIVYAGAILITYLFVIMLATETPTADEVEALAEYDRYSREPIFATATGFVLIAVLGTALAGGRGAGSLTPATRYAAGRHLSELSVRVERSLREAKLIEPGEHIIVNDSLGRPAIDVEGGTILVGRSGAEAGQTEARIIPREQWPADVHLNNTEGVAFSLLSSHPGAIEIAGVILLMAMLGAVVLARKRVDLDEQARAEADRRQLVDPVVGGSS